MKAFLKTAFAAAAFAIVAMAAGAAAYDLYDHPSGQYAATQDYGLRLDGHATDKFFSFEDTSGNSLARLTVDFGSGTAGITGQMRNNSDNSIWTLMVSMTGVAALDGIGSFGATDYTASLSNGGGTTYNLDGKAKDINGVGYEWTLFLQNLGGNTDWRGPNITAGWVGASNGQMLSGTNDFIGTVVPVPLPAGAVLLLTGLGALGVARRRRTT